MAELITLLPAGSDHRFQPVSTLPVKTLSERRAQVLGPQLRQFYEFPFEPVRGEGTSVFDAEGHRYLDAYNNVPHVGHAHPAVVAAMSQQAGLLNSNTRYLHERVVEYAERLVATMPPGLSQCLFTCTGTEANDLAWRLATAFTGASGAIATEYGYYGNSTMVIALDGAPRATPLPNPPSWVARIPAPTPGSDPAGCAADMERAINALAAAGHRPAACYLDLLFASDGVCMPEPGLLTPALDRLRAACGLCVADEIQPGLGRTGRDMWGFQTAGITPDIVTMGKPMGNGFPIGVVVTRPEITAAFFSQHRYFNTFAGSPVAAATGLAVLDVLDQEELIVNARQVGDRLKADLLALRQRHEVVTDVRGIGFFLGVELTRDGQPATRQARWVINELCRRKVLVGLTGPSGNVLKIRPPMVFSQENAAQLVQTLDAVLADLP